MSEKRKTPRKPRPWLFVPTADRQPGLRVGKLVLLRKDPDKPKPHVWWVCQCDCGKTVSVRGNRLGTETNSCGCIRRGKETARPAPRSLAKIIPPGTRFQHLVVVGEPVRNSKGHNYFTLRCDCGNLCQKRGSWLHTEAVQASCGWVGCTYKGRKYTPEAISSPQPVDNQDDDLFDDL